jgi:hypothetical protein
MPIDYKKYPKKLSGKIDATDFLKRIKQDYGK